VLNVSTLLLNNISKTMTPFLNAAVNEALWQLVPFFHNGLFQLTTVVNFGYGRLVAEQRPKQHNPRDLDPGCLGPHLRLDE